MRDESAQAGILIIEEDREIAALLRTPLRRKGYRVRHVVKREQAITRALGHPPGLIVIGPGLWKTESLALCRKLREGSLAPSALIVVVTAQTEETDVVESLEAGADACLAAPLNGRISVARIEALLRMRSMRLEEQAAGWENRRIARAGLLVIDRDRYLVEYSGRPIKLTPAQRDLLWVMVLNCEKALSREELRSVASQRARSAGFGSVDRQLAQIRKQLGRGGHCIETLTGYGYKLHREPLPGNPTSQGRIEQRHSN
jgi:DNA-binding response OmpR family regulator